MQRMKKKMIQITRIIKTIKNRVIVKAGIKTERIWSGHSHKFEQVPCIDDVEGSENVRSKLNMVLKLGNTFKSRCKLVFNTTTGRKAVYGIIWNVTDEYLELKGGTTLLISSIEDIKLV